MSKKCSNVINASCIYQLTHYHCVIEIPENGLLHLDWLLLAVVKRDNEVEEVALSHVVRGLLFKLCWRQRVHWIHSTRWKKMQLPRTVTHKLHYALLSQKKCALLRITIKYCQNSSYKYFFSISHDHNYCININCPHGWELAMDYWLVFTDKIENFHHLLWMTKMHAPGSHSKANSTYICMNTCSQMYYSLHAFFLFLYYNISDNE